MALCWNFACIYLFYAFHFVKGSETKKLTLNATEIYKNNTIKLTCNIHEGTARSVGWYRNQGRKVISIGYVHGLCETSPPELPFSAECRCLDITLYTCTLTVEPSVHSGDEWECSYADNGLSIKSNEVRISGSNVSHTTTDSPSTVSRSTRRSDVVKKAVYIQETTQDSTTVAIEKTKEDTTHAGKSREIPANRKDVDFTTMQNPAKLSGGVSDMTIILAPSCGGVFLVATVVLIICCMKRKKRGPDEQSENATMRNGVRTQSIVNTLERIYANNSEARRPSDEQARIGQRNGNASNGNAQEDQYYLHATDKQANEPLGNDENVYYAIGNTTSLDRRNSGFQNASRLCRTLPALRPCTNATDEQARIGQRNGNASNGNAQEDQYYLHATDQQANEPHENDENVYYAIGNTTSLDRRNSGFQNASRLFRTLPALRPCTNATDRFRPPDEILRPKRAIVSSGAEYAVPDTELCTIDIGGRSSRRGDQEPPGYEKLDDCNRTYETMYTFIKTAGMK
ncbi:uncharacterized protein LOC128222427 [Mya arenaria]|uniref:uncharacterized protein LOC128222427 n=1 Tax=Mya arenaria TaxID=6604 RepID=UPI0022E6375C|nr:uncharacterized protein LOC128222427 [Mya arenaria]